MPCWRLEILVKISTFAQADTVTRRSWQSHRVEVSGAEATGCLRFVDILQCLMMDGSMISTGQVVSNHHGHSLRFGLPILSATNTSCAVFNC